MIQLHADCIIYFNTVKTYNKILFSLQIRNIEEHILIIRYNSTKWCLYLSFNYSEGHDSSKISLLYGTTEWVSRFLSARRLFNGEFSLPRLLIFSCSRNTWKHFSTLSVICFIHHIKRHYAGFGTESLK